MPGRLEYERAIRRSDLPPPSRHLALTIATWADMDTGLIPERFQPSLTTLEGATGLGRTTVRDHLNAMESAGWLIRDRPAPADARKIKARTHYRLAIPARARAALAEEELGREAPQPRAGGAPDLGREPTQARAGAAPKSPYESHESRKSRAAGEPASSRRKPKQPKPSKHQVADDLTDAFWKRHGKGWAQSFVAVRSVVRTAIGNGVDRDQLAHVLDGLAREGRSISGGTIQTALGKLRGANGYRPYADPDNQDAYDGDM